MYGIATAGTDGGTNISSIGESTDLLMSCIIKLNLSDLEIISRTCPNSPARAPNEITFFKIGNPATDSE